MPVVNSCAPGRLYSLDLNLFEVCEDLLSELKLTKGSVDLKSCSRGTGIHKYAEATLKKFARTPWKYHGKIMEFCHCRKVGTLGLAICRKWSKTLFSKKKKHCTQIMATIELRVSICHISSKYGTGCQDQFLRVCHV